MSVCEAFKIKDVYTNHFTGNKITNVGILI